MIITNESLDDLSAQAKASPRLRMNLDLRNSPSDGSQRMLNALEPGTGHLKSDHRMMRNYLKGTLGDAINTLMAAAAYNMRHWMNKNASSSFVSWLLALVRRLENVLFENENQYACRYSVLAGVA